jgi:prefoldin subunit 5
MSKLITESRDMLMALDKAYYRNPNEEIRKHIDDLIFALARVIREKNKKLPFGKDVDDALDYLKKTLEECRKLMDSPTVQGVQGIKEGLNRFKTVLSNRLTKLETKIGEIESKIYTLKSKAAERLKNNDLEGARVYARQIVNLENTKKTIRNMIMFLSDTIESIENGMIILDAVDEIRVLDVEALSLEQISMYMSEAQKVLDTITKFRGQMEQMQNMMKVPDMAVEEQELAVLEDIMESLDNVSEDLMKKLDELKERQKILSELSR